MKGLWITPITGLPSTATHTMVVTYFRRFSVETQTGFTSWYSTYILLQQQNLRNETTNPTWITYTNKVANIRYNFIPPASFLKNLQLIYMIWFISKELYQTCVFLSGVQWINPHCDFFCRNLLPAWDLSQNFFRDDARPQSGLTLCVHMFFWVHLQTGKKTTLWRTFTQRFMLLKALVHFYIKFSW